MTQISDSSRSVVEWPSALTVFQAIRRIATYKKLASTGNWQPTVSNREIINYLRPDWPPRASSLDERSPEWRAYEKRLWPFVGTLEGLDFIVAETQVITFDNDGKWQPMDQGDDWSLTDSAIQVIQGATDEDIALEFRRRLQVNLERHIDGCD